MKLKYMEEIADTCCEFFNQVIDRQGCLEYDTLMERVRDICNDFTDHDNGFIDIDYKSMTFTVCQDDFNMWHLSENATYYLWNINENGDLEVSDTIDVEL